MFFKLKSLDTDKHTLDGVSSVGPVGPREHGVRGEWTHLSMYHVSPSILCHAGPVAFGGPISHVPMGLWPFYTIFLIFGSKVL